MRFYSKDVLKFMLNLSDNTATPTDYSVFFDDTMPTDWLYAMFEEKVSPKASTLSSYYTLKAILDECTHVIESLPARKRDDILRSWSTGVSKPREGSPFYALFDVIRTLAVEEDCYSELFGKFDGFKSYDKADPLEFKLAARNSIEQLRQHKFFRLTRNIFDFNQSSEFYGMNLKESVLKSSIDLIYFCGNASAVGDPHYGKPDEQLTIWFSLMQPYVDAHQKIWGTVK